MASLRGWSLSGRAARGAPTAPPPGQPSELLPPLRQAPDLESGGGGGRGQEDGAGGRGDDARAGWARLGIPHPQTPHYEQQLFRTYRGFMGKLPLPPSPSSCTREGLSLQQKSCQRNLTTAPWLEVGAR